MFKALLLGLAFFCALSARAQIGDELGLSPHWDWKTIESEHFRLTFPKELEKTARRSAQYFEEAYDLLTARLMWKPKDRAQILIVDNTDSANGLTSPVERLGITLLVTPPDSWFSTAYYDDWLRLLVFHEYTHYVNMDTTLGLYEGLRYLIGPTVLPNSIWPPWMLEGLAVYMETRLTRGGRGRSPYYEMVLRAAVESRTLDTDRFVTLDRVNAGNPYYPGGETDYLFGYELMNQVARTPFPNHETADGLNQVERSEDALGLMSLRSAARFPFFINGNLENITGKDWYAHWDDFVRETRERMEKDLARLKAAPLTPVERLTERGYGVLGSAASPDGHWLAYTQESLDHRTSLYLRNLDTGDVRRLTDKARGVGMAFTPDSAQLVYSEMDRKSVYAFWSDLRVHDLKQDSSYWLTDSLRAKDPDVSPDGKWVVFTVAEDATTALVVAPIEIEEGRLKLGLPRKLFQPTQFGRVSDPRFSRDSKLVAFSFQRNGTLGSDILVVHLEGTESGPTALVDDGAFNRFPVYDLEGRLTFVSDRTGVDNLYRFGATGPEMITNVTTGLALPAFGPKGLYASVFGVDGWDLARIEPAQTPYDPKLLTVEKPPAPEPDTTGSPAGRARAADLEMKDYSIFPSIWPREWLPILYIGQQGIYAGGQVLGFDAVDRHRYVLAGAYDSEIRKADYFALYANRSLGPTLSLSASERTDSSFRYEPTAQRYIRKFDADATLSYPFVWTWSALTPTLGFHADREAIFDSGVGPDPYDKSDYVPSIYGILQFSDAESSRIGNGPEAGRTALLGARLYDESGVQSLKGLASVRQYLRLSDHSVLIPSLKASASSRQAQRFSPASVHVRGRILRLIDNLPGADFDEIGVRGYPNLLIYARQAVVGALDFRFPLWRIHRGLGTNPLGFDDLYGFVFGESAYFPESGAVFRTLPSAGGGVVLDLTALVRLPVELSLQYHKGFNVQRGGQGELFLGMNLAAFSF
jgi:hypothetical protein